MSKMNYNRPQFRSQLHPTAKWKEDLERRDAEWEVRFKITKCPPGRALGADDLQRWARQRNVGRSGVPDKSDSKIERGLSKRAKRLAKRKQKKGILAIGLLGLEQAKEPKEQDDIIPCRKCGARSPHWLCDDCHKRQWDGQRTQS